MDIPTQEAFDAISDFASNEDVAKRLTLFLTESPIGDEYGVLTDEDVKYGSLFLKYLELRGIDAFEKAGL